MVLVGGEKEGWTDKKISAAIFIGALVFYAAMVLFAGGSSFAFDEGAYALMVKEFSENPGMVMPTVTGEHPEWKPPFFAWVYSAFYFFLKWFPLPTEAIMRLPSAFFGAGSICLTFLIGKRIYDRRAGIYAAAILFFAPLMVFCSVLAMIDALAIFISLAAIYAYLNGKFGAGAALLGLIVLTKWIYVAFPAAFILFFFWGKKEFNLVGLSLLAIPIAFAAYLSLAALFGDFNHALDASILYIFRASSETDSSALLLSNIYEAFYETAPFYVFFIFLLVFSRKTIMENLPVSAVCMLAMLSQLFSQFIFWYMAPALPAFALLFARAVEGVNDRHTANLLVILLIFFGIFFGGMGPYIGPYTGVKEVSAFMAGKEALFVEPGDFFANWVDTKRNYLGTDAERLLLEQHNPGFLFYRFGERGDYGNLRIAFIHGLNETYVPPCEKYLVVHERDRLMNYTYSMEIPECYVFLWREGDYAAYAGEGGG